MTRRNGIDRDAGFGHLCRPLPDHPVQGRFGRRVSRYLRLATYGGNGPGKDDAPIALPGHTHRNVPTQSPLRGQIARNNTFELLLRERQQRLAMLYARIGKEYIDLSQVIEHCVDRRNSLIDLPNIERRSMHLDALLAPRRFRRLDRKSTSLN